HPLLTSSPMADNTKIHNVKRELLDPDPMSRRNFFPRNSVPAALIELSSSDSDSSSSDDDGQSSNAKKKSKKTAEDYILPVGFLDPLPSKKTPSLPLLLPPLPRDERLRLECPSARARAIPDPSSKQFWKAGDYEGTLPGDWNTSNGGMDHVRVHPKFLHSNATSHKWVLGAFAELLDNSLDEVCNGATYVNIDMVKSKKDGSKMLLIEDNGGGMDPEKIRHCMSLGYSEKSKQVDTIGQYGNGFKTSTMRLGADVIVFSRCSGMNGQRKRQDWNQIIRSSGTDWDRNVETIIQWSPFSSEADLLRQFNQMQDQGTQIIIYNLWEDDQGLLELDFDTDLHDIQIRGVNRDEKSIDMAKKYPNSKHFLTYRHSLRSYAAILYLRVPPNFRIILRGEDVEHHNVVNDMMMSQEVTYRPQPGADGIPKDSNMMAVVTVGFVKDAKAHIDVQGFNVYHKNRLIKPFWRVWTPPGSDGRGVIGVLEANFVEPAHDKQGFERTTVLARLETRLVQMQKNYWTCNCHKIGYAARRNKNVHEREISPDSDHRSPRKKKNIGLRNKTQANFMEKGNNNEYSSGKGDVRSRRKQPSYTELSSSSEEDERNNYRQNRTPRSQVNGSSSKNTYEKDGLQKPSGLRRREAAKDNLAAETLGRATRSSHPQENGYNNNEFSPSSSSQSLAQLREENLKLKERLEWKEDETLGDLLHDILKEKERTKSLEAQLQETTQKYEELKAEQESLIDIFSEEKQRRDKEEQKLRLNLKEARNTIQQLMDRIKSLDNSKYG
ncbi:histidine kinase, partial [Striga asiatica]